MRHRSDSGRAFSKSSTSEATCSDGRGATAPCAQTLRAVVVKPIRFSGRNILVFFQAAREVVMALLTIWTCLARVYWSAATPLGVQSVPGGQTGSFRAW